MKTLCFIGTTITCGARDRDALGWAGRLTRQFLREGHSVHHYNLGIPGETLPVLAKRAEREAKPRLEGVEDALVFVEPGHADLALLKDSRRRTDATTFEAHLTVTMDVLDGMAPVVLVGPTPVIERGTLLPCPVTGEMIRYSNTPINAVSRRLAALADERGILYLDLFEEMSKGTAYTASIEDDPYGVDPASGGHKLIAEYAHARLASVMVADDVADNSIDG